jgi:succinylarginine dihydrolase
MTTGLIEVNFDGIVGPTHHFGGLGVGNVASMKHRGFVSNPQLAALQGIAKMRRVASILDPERAMQAVLPPQLRPNIHWLRSLGFNGDTAQVLQDAERQAPHLLHAAWSASAMWAANAATVSPASDCVDGRTHFTVANLSSSSHRSFEHQETFDNLTRVFSDTSRFQVHPALPGGFAMRDEGAANHMRLWGPGQRSAEDCQGRAGIEIFVHGCRDGASGQRFLARQSEDSSRAIGRLHHLLNDNTFFLQQHPAAIDAGAFHNDVVATSCENVLLYHELAFFDSEGVLEAISLRFEEIYGAKPIFLRIDTSQVSLEEAVASYFFNSQLVADHRGGLTLISPMQCYEMPTVRREIARIIAADNPVSRVEYVDLRESMWNGGGPACLRLRVSLSREDLSRVRPSVFWTESLAECLENCVREYYREHVSDGDLSDASFATQAIEATEKIREILELVAD